MNSNVVRLVQCPSCRKPTPYSDENAYRPFCCRACKDGDTIAWIDEQYRVPGQFIDEETEEFAQLESADRND
jgi:endogenous inhibitor of DNA gyrase (YacG/DUF329 family)